MGTDREAVHIITADLSHLMLMQSTKMETSDLAFSDLFLNLNLVAYINKVTITANLGVKCVKVVMFANIS